MRDSPYRREAGGKKVPGGLFRARLAVIVLLLNQRRSVFGLLWAGRAGGRMDLPVAVEQRTAILDVSGHAVDSRRGHRPDRQGAGFQRVQEVAVRLPEGHTEGRRNGGEVWLSAGLDTRLPSLEAVDISRLDCPARMRATRFAAVFDVDPEDHPFR